MQKTFQSSVFPNMPMFKNDPAHLEQFFLEYKEAAKVKFRKTRSLQINDAMVNAANAYIKNAITTDEYLDLVGIKKSFNKKTGEEDKDATSRRAGSHVTAVLRKYHASRV